MKKFNLVWNIHGMELNLIYDEKTLDILDVEILNPKGKEVFVEVDDGSQLLHSRLARSKLSETTSLRTKGLKMKVYKDPQTGEEMIVAPDNLSHRTLTKR